VLAEEVAKKVAEKVAEEVVEEVVEQVVEVLAEEVVEEVAEVVVEQVAEVVVKELVFVKWLIWNKEESSCRRSSRREFQGGVLINPCAKTAAERLCLELSRVYHVAERFLLVLYQYLQRSMHPQILNFYLLCVAHIESRKNIVAR
jgi:hypothetical protein